MFRRKPVYPLTATGKAKNLLNAVKGKLGALNVFTNYFDVATDVDIDFPKVSFAEVA